MTVFSCLTVCYVIREV